MKLFNPLSGDRADARDIILLFTDGVPTREVANLTGEVEQLRARNIRVVAVGITDQVAFYIVVLFSNICF